VLSHPVAYKVQLWSGDSAPNSHVVAGFTDAPVDWCSEPLTPRPAVSTTRWFSAHFLSNASNCPSLVGAVSWKQARQENDPFLLATRFVRLQQCSQKRTWMLLSDLFTASMRW